MASYGRGSFDQHSSYQGVGQGGNDNARLAQAVGSNIQKITQNVEQIRRLVEQIGTSQDSEELREKLHQTQHFTNQVAKDANRDLKDLAHKPLPSDPSQLRQAKMQRERLTEEFSNALKEFQTMQRNAAEKERASIKRTRAHSTNAYTGFDDFGTQQQDQFSQEGFSKTAEILQMENDVDLELIKEREGAIVQLEKDIMDVNQIFKDLGMLVHEQGEMLDSIEANVDMSEIKVQEGVSQLSQARNYQSKARRKKCCLLVVLLIVLAVIGIIIAISVTQSKN